MNTNMSPMLGPVNIIVALSCEAKPLIAHFKLKRTSDRSGFVVYENKQNITLIVTGIGKIPMAAACGYLAGLQINKNQSKSAWLNVGIAGHKRSAIGIALLVHKVTDSTSGNTHYPPLLLDINCETTELISVDVPETVYRENSAYDMEGSAFYGVASRFVSSELVQIVKIVSDNLDNPSGQITKNKIQAWVTANLATIAATVDQLQSITFDYNSVYALSSQTLRLVEKVHLTASQQVQLKNLVSRFHALGGTELESKLVPESYRSSRNLIKKLKLLIEEI